MSAAEFAGSVERTTVPDPPATARTPPPAADAESRAWLEALQGDGPRREDAVGRLGELLLAAARTEVRRRAATTPSLRGSDHEDIARQAADDALMAVLRKLDTYRGASRFTTWAYKFALLEAAVAMRRRSWQGREVVLAPEHWGGLAAAGSTARDAETGELLAAMTTAIREQLTAHQREVLVALAVEGVPIDVLAERLGSTRGALYKALHDARRKLRATLSDQGLGPDGASEEATR